MITNIRFMMDGIPVMVRCQIFLDDKDHIVCRSTTVQTQREWVKKNYENFKFAQEADIIQMMHVNQELNKTISSQNKEIDRLNKIIENLKNAMDGMTAQVSDLSNTNNKDTKPHTRSNDKYYYNKLLIDCIMQAIDKLDPINPMTNKPVHYSFRSLLEKRLNDTLLHDSYLAYMLADLLFSIKFNGSINKELTGILNDIVYFDELLVPPISTLELGTLFAVYNTSTKDVRKHIDLDDLEQKVRENNYTFKPEFKDKSWEYQAIDLNELVECAAKDWLNRVQ